MISGNAIAKDLRNGDTTHRNVSRRQTTGCDRTFRKNRDQPASMLAEWVDGEPVEHQTDNWNIFGPNPTSGVSKFKTFCLPTLPEFFR